MKVFQLVALFLVIVVVATTNAGLAYSAVSGGLINGGLIGGGLVNGGLIQGGLANGGLIGSGLYGAHGIVTDYYAHPAYKYDYAVHDPHTGDVKNQWESRNGDVVKGSYSLKEADGTTRVVEYAADGHNGFNAIVKRIGHAHHPVVHGYGHGYGY